MCLLAWLRRTVAGVLPWTDEVAFAADVQAIWTDLYGET